MKLGIMERRQRTRQEFHNFSTRQIQHKIVENDKNRCNNVTYRVRTFESIQDTCNVQSRQINFTIPTMKTQKLPNFNIKRKKH
jgi:Tfp pilus assembly ATPase PilU